MCSCWIDSMAILVIVRGGVNLYGHNRITKVGRRWCCDRVRLYRAVQTPIIFLNQKSGNRSRLCGLKKWNRRSQSNVDTWILIFLTFVLTSNKCCRIDSCLLYWCINTKNQRVLIGGNTVQKIRNIRPHINVECLCPSSVKYPFQIWFF